MTSTVITDALIDRACYAFDAACEDQIIIPFESMRAALLAVAPMILEEVAKALPTDVTGDEDPWEHGYNAALEQSRATIRALKEPRP
jgi:hypothetical protein